MDVSLNVHWLRLPFRKYYFRLSRAWCQKQKIDSYARRAVKLFQGLISCSLRWELWKLNFLRLLERNEVMKESFVSVVQKFRPLFSKYRTSITNSYEGIDQIISFCREREELPSEKRRFEIYTSNFSSASLRDIF